MQKYLLTMMLAVVVSTAGAKDVYWSGAANDGNVFQTPANWVGGQAPANTDIAVFDVGGSLCLSNSVSHAAWPYMMYSGGMKVLSGDVYFQAQGTISFNVATSYVHVVAGSTLCISNFLSGNLADTAVLVKTGGGTLSVLNRLGYSGSSGEWAFGYVDLKEGTLLRNPVNGYGTWVKQLHIHSGAEFLTDSYSVIAYACGIQIDKGGVCTLNGDTWLDGFSGDGTLRKTTTSGVKLTLTQSVRNYVFTGSVNGITFISGSVSPAYAQSWGVSNAFARLVNVTFGDSIAANDFDLTATEGLVADGAVFFKNAGAVDFAGALLGTGTVSATCPVTLRDFSLKEALGTSAFSADATLAGGDARLQWLNISNSKKLVVTGGRHRGIRNLDLNTYETFFTRPRPTGIYLQTSSVSQEPAFVVSNALVRIGNLHGSNPLGAMRFGEGGIVEMVRGTSIPAGMVGDVPLYADGGTLRFLYVLCPYSFDWPANHFAWTRTMKVGAKGARVETLTEGSFALASYRFVNNRMGAVSDVAAGEDGGMVFDVPGTMRLYRPQAVTGPVALEDGRLVLDPGAVTNAADGAALGTGDFTFGNGWLSFNDGSTEALHIRLASASGKKARFARAAMVSVRTDGVGQTVTLGPDDAALPALVRDGAGASLFVRTEATNDVLNGLNGSLRVNGGVAKYANGRVKDPIFAFARLSVDVYRANFVTYDDTLGLVEFPEGAFTSGVGGGIDSVALVDRYANGATLTIPQGATPRVGALRVDGAAGGVPLQIATGAVLGIGDGTNVACVILNNARTSGSASITGPGSLDFGTSEGLFAVSAPIGSRAYAPEISAVIAGSGGVTFNGPYGILEPWVHLRAANTYTGGTRINTVSVRVSHAQALGRDLVDVGRGCGCGGQVRFMSALTMTNAFRISGNGARHYAGYTNHTDNGAIWFSQSATLTGPVEIVRDARITARDNAQATGTLAGVVSGGRLQLMRSNGNIVLANANTFTGGTELVASTLTLKQSTSAGTGEIELDASTLRFENDAPITFANAISGLGTIVLAGTAPVTFTDASFADLPARTLYPGSSFAYPVDGTAVYEFGDGSEIDFGAKAVTVAAIGGTGTVKNGTLTVTDAIRPGGPNAIGTLTFENVAIAGVAKLEIELLGSEADKLVIDDADLANLALDVKRLGSYTAPRNAILVSGGVVAGAFASVALPDASYSVWPGANDVMLLHDLGTMVILR